ncbi:MAG TPA: hypothetical protein VGR37_24185 [Longimicrobiaceae bacterium]|nr:hypothetical protein [Longimicrobiaceae bacterium]
MSDPESLDTPPEERPAPNAIQVEQPGGCFGCGPTGCLTGFVVMFALLLVAMVAIALFRDWPRPGLPGMP